MHTECDAGGLRADEAHQRGRKHAHHLIDVRDDRPVDLERLAVEIYGGVTCRLDVADPVEVCALGEWDDDVLVGSVGHHRRGVGHAASAVDMVDGQLTPGPSCEADPSHPV